MDCFYRRLKDIREDHDLTQKQAAEKLGITQQQYSLYETGRREIPTSLLIQLADIFDISTDYLLGRTDLNKPIE